MAAVKSGEPPSTLRPRLFFLRVRRVVRRVVRVRARREDVPRMLSDAKLGELRVLSATDVRQTGQSL